MQPLQSKMAVPDCRQQSRWAGVESSKEPLKNIPIFQRFLSLQELSHTLWLAVKGDVDKQQFELSILRAVAVIVAGWKSACTGETL